MGSYVGVGIAPNKSLAHTLPDRSRVLGAERGRFLPEASA
jgi:hypothetical protein